MARAPRHLFCRSESVLVESRPLLVQVGKNVPNGVTLTTTAIIRKMNYRRLGKTELKVSALGLGCARLGSVTQAGGDQAALRVIGAAIDAGINFFDTSDIYGQGRSETLLAKALKGQRDRVIIATKGGFCLSSLGLVAKHIKPLVRKFLKSKPKFAHSIQKVRAAQQKQDFSASYLPRSVEGSLKRLHTEALDVFLLHSPVTEVLQQGEVFQTLDSLKAQGKVRHYGVSCRKAGDMASCLAHASVSVLQVELNLLHPEVLAEVLPAARSQDAGIVARQALAGGLLLRSPGELRPEDCASREESFEQLRGRIEEAAKNARQSGRTLPHMAIQYLLEQAAISSVLIGTTNAEHLKAHLPRLDQPVLNPQ